MQIVRGPESKSLNPLLGWNHRLLLPRRSPPTAHKRRKISLYFMMSEIIFPSIVCTAADAAFLEIFMIANMRMGWRERERERESGETSIYYGARRFLHLKFMYAEGFCSGFPCQGFLSSAET
jgi:hypothetical protein